MVSKSRICAPGGGIPTTEGEKGVQDASVPPPPQERHLEGAGPVKQLGETAVHPQGQQL